MRLNFKIICRLRSSDLICHVGLRSLILRNLFWVVMFDRMEMKLRHWTEIVANISWLRFCKVKSNKTQHLISTLCFYVSSLFILCSFGPSNKPTRMQLLLRRGSHQFWSDLNVISDKPFTIKEIEEWIQVTILTSTYTNHCLSLVKDTIFRFLQRWIWKTEKIKSKKQGSKVRWIWSCLDCGLGLCMVLMMSRRSLMRKRKMDHSKSATSCNAHI